MKTRFSACWSDALGAAIDKASVQPYSMEFHASSADYQSFERAVNQGIDSHLQAIRFSQYWKGFGRVKFTLEPQSVSVLVRRLLESGDENDMSLASSICDTLGIELI